MKKILLVEDELSYIKLLEEQLHENGYQVLSANDGKQGLALAKTQRPDIILLDIRMPIMDGLTMLDELRKDNYGRDAKVILLTNLEPNDAMLKKVLDNKPSYYLVKSDIQLTDLLEKIEELLLS